MDAYIAVDFGTSHIKCAAFSPKGELLCRLREPVPVEQDDFGDVYAPQKVYGIVLAQLAELRRRWNFLGIAVTGMSEAGLLVHRESGQEASVMLPWYSRRTETLAEEGRGQDEENFYCTGLRNSYKYGLYKYQWLLQRASAPQKDLVWLSACDYLAWKLTGQFVTDPTFAARTYLYDINAGDWSETALAENGINRKNLPVILPSGAVGGFLQNAGLSCGGQVPVAVAGHDHLCAAYALLQQEENGICDSMGTAETYVGHVPARPLTKADYESGLVFGPFVQPGRMYWMANVVSSGMSVEWLRKLGGPPGQPLPYEALEKQLEALGSGPTGILFGPFLAGVGTPLFTSAPQGCFIGLTERTGYPQMMKSVMEGVAMQGRYVLGLAPQAVAKAPLMGAGGASNSPQWMQIKADAMGRPLNISAVKEGTLLGAAALMAAKLGSPMRGTGGVAAQYVPNLAHSAAYNKQ